MHGRDIFPVQWFTIHFQFNWYFSISLSLCRFPSVCFVFKYSKLITHDGWALQFNNLFFFFLFLLALSFRLCFYFLFSALNSHCFLISPLVPSFHSVFIHSLVKTQNELVLCCITLMSFLFLSTRMNLCFYVGLHFMYLCSMHTHTHTRTNDLKCRIVQQHPVLCLCIQIFIPII